MIVTVDGHTCYAYTSGRELAAGATSLVFIHGAAHDHGVWSLQSRYFAAHGCNSIAVDLPGHGRSAGAALASIGALADWVAALLDALQLPQATLIGHSMGSLVALEAAARYPARVDRLVLIGCTAPMPVSDALLAAARDDTRAAVAMITQWSHAPATLLGASPVPGLWLPVVNARLMARAAPGVLHRDLANCRDYVGGIEAATAVKCPVLLVAGSRDLMTPPKSLTGLRAALPRHDLRTIDGAGHALMSERPDAVLDTLRAFIAN